MTKRQILLWLCLLLFLWPQQTEAQTDCYTPTSPKRETRAVWLTTYASLDWPKAKATGPDGAEAQKAELRRILDRLQEARLNTVLLQTRVRGSVIYPSAIEPWDACLTGTAGRSPGYDPLAFAIEECHRRGMECHAWMVTIPLGGRKHVAALGRSSVTKKKPAICVPYKRQYFLNPGHPQTKEYLMSLVREVVERYDVDGVHFDYLRYPERKVLYRDCPPSSKDTMPNTPSIYPPIPNSSPRPSHIRYQQEAVPMPVGAPRDLHPAHRHPARKNRL